MLLEILNDHLDMLAKLYELWSLEEIQLSQPDLSFLEALSDVVYSANDPHAYIFTQRQQTKLKKLWGNYEQGIRKLPK